MREPRGCEAPNDLTKSQIVNAPLRSNYPTRAASSSTQLLDTVRTAISLNSTMVSSSLLDTEALSPCGIDVLVEMIVLQFRLGKGLPQPGKT